jgi:hypothetical protein
MPVIGLSITQQAVSSTKEVETLAFAPKTFVVSISLELELVVVESSLETRVS